MKVNVNEVIRQISVVNPNDYYTKISFIDIIKDSIDFKTRLIFNKASSMDEDINPRIELTFKWLKRPKNGSFITEFMIWYIDLDEYQKNYRKFKIKKLLT